VTAAAGDGDEWYRSLAVGHEERTPELVVTEGALRQLVALSGYRHPLFTDPAHAAALAGGVPVPGGLLLGMLGGLVERCPLLEAAPVVLAGFGDVRFRRLVVAGDTLRADLRGEGKRITDGGTGLVEVSWVAYNQRDEVVVSLVAVFAVRGASTPD
jgi:acyl dehydratase